MPASAIAMRRWGQQLVVLWVPQFSGGVAETDVGRDDDVGISVVFKVTLTFERSGYGRGSYEPDDYGMKEEEREMMMTKLWCILIEVVDENTQ